jgi:hypothetical protein
MTNRGDDAGREDILTRKAERLVELEYDVGSYRWVTLFGVAMLGLGGWIDWLTLVTLRDAFVDGGESIVPAGEEPGLFYAGLVLVVGMGVLCTVQGVRMLLHVRKERRRTARLAERLRRVGRGAR